MHNLLSLSLRRLMKPSSLFKPLIANNTPALTSITRQFTLTSRVLDTNNSIKPVDVTLSELLKLIQSDSKKTKDFTLIDVREKQERLEGAIPNSKWLPLGELESALKLDPHDFKAKYKFEKFETDKPVIFHCRSGVRSGKAQDIAIQLGYKNARNYKGSWLEFSKEKPELVWIDQDLK
ncbi:Rhodanese-like protein [Neoconidiobolus thromboides FSU 785]|nr:Rhodanese-like protein [Neoconidiobolus thromboides FSU 785]